MNPSRLSYQISLAAVTGLLLGLLCHLAFHDRGQREASDHSSSLLSRDHSSQTPSAALPIGPTTTFLRRIPTASAEECATMALECFEQKQRGKELELEAVFRRWLAFESPETILKKLREFDGQWRSDCNAAFFHAWVALDENAAMAETQYSQLNPARALFAIRNADPDFASYCVNTSHSFSFEDKAQAALTAMARNRPDVARLIADADLPKDFKTDCITAVARGMAMNDPAAAVTWLQSLELADLGNPLAVVFSEWLKIDPSAARKAHGSLGLNSIRLNNSIALQALTALTTPESASGQLSLALHRDPFIDVAGLYRELTASGANLAKPGYSMAAINHDGWYGVDPAADARAAEELPAGKARDFIMSAICQNWAAHDQEAALRYADAHGLDSPAIKSLRNQPTDALRETVLSAPEEHFKNLFDTGEPKEMNREQRLALAKEWSAADPIAVANWLITQQIPNRQDPGGPEAEMFRKNTFGYYWANNDPLGASRWMEALPDGPEKSNAWSAMEHYVSRYSPDLAFALSAAYLDGDSRDRYLASELKAVRESIGLPAALELLKSPDLTADESAALATALKVEK